jgi:hypothetical protein
MSETRIRVIGPSDGAAAADAVDRALCEAGFLLVTGHGVDPAR